MKKKKYEVTEKDEIGQEEFMSNRIPHAHSLGKILLRYICRRDNSPEKGDRHICCCGGVSSGRCYGRKDDRRGGGEGRGGRGDRREGKGRG